jgi:hypothetical protein
MAAHIIMKVLIVLTSHSELGDIGKKTGFWVEEFAAPYYELADDAGTATLIIGALHRVDGVYSGNYQIKVFPYFLKNENGTLAIDVSDESLAMINHGKIAAITGTATTSGKDGRSRPIEATATPADINHGNLKLWFMAGDRKMTFQPAYHFAGKNTAAVLAQAVAIQP